MIFHLKVFVVAASIQAKPLCIDSLTIIDSFHVSLILNLNTNQFYDKISV